MLAALLATMSLPHSARAETSFKRVPTQFIAALGDPGATSGTGAQAWGLWTVDPGPRGVPLGNYDDLKAAGGLAPSQWIFDSSNWWVDENGILMEQPDFPLPPGKYLVTGDREVTSILTIYPIGQDGAQRWQLDKGATLYDVTHLPCRSARYTSPGKDISCSPSNAQQNLFPVTPGAAMPPIDGCEKQDYAVLFVIGIAVEN